MTRGAMNITLLEKNDLVNIGIQPSFPTLLDTEVNIDGWQHVVKGKTFQDFLSAPETFKFEDRDWKLELGWE